MQGRGVCSWACEQAPSSGKLRRAPSACLWPGHRSGQKTTEINQEDSMGGTRGCYRAGRGMDLGVAPFR